MTCCDFHTLRCEPPSELCCDACPEVHHPRHPDGEVCVLPAPVDSVTIDLEPVERPDGVAVLHLSELGVSEVDFYTWEQVEQFARDEECGS